VAVSLLILIRFPLIMLPMTIGAVVMGMVSLKRIQKFLLYNDMPRFKDHSEKARRTFSRKQANLPPGTIAVCENDFAWAIQQTDSSSSSGSTMATPPQSPMANTPSKKLIDNQDSSSSSSSSSRRNEGSNGDVELTGTLDGNDSDDKMTAAVVSSPSPSSPSSSQQGVNTDSNWKLKLKDFTVKPGTLLAVTGRVGSGKSSFLAALLGELDIDEDLEQSPVLAGSVSYAPQQPWIMNATLRDNIIFGKPFLENVYREVTCLYIFIYVTNIKRKINYAQIFLH
jgi:ATP-binding cassette, subfamily C (CFTR/MRP), member 1